MLRPSVLLSAFIAVLPVLAQHAPLPNGLAPEEVPLIPAYHAGLLAGGRGITAPPDVPVRTMAEWEEIQALAICWRDYPGVLKPIVRAAKDECRVLIVCDDSTAVTSALLDNTFGGPLPDLNNITFLQAPSNSVWMRDYGAECIYANEVDSLYLLDWIYNRPRPQDDLLPDAIGTFEHIGVYSTTEAPNDLVHTGGNFMADGAGTAFSSDLVLDENGPAGVYNLTVKDEAQVDAIMQAYMGIAPERYIKMTTLPYDGIHHIDMHMKLLDEETLLVGEFPQGVSDGPQLETNVSAIVNNEVDAFGQPYHLVRIPMPSSTGGQYPPQASYRTYANNVFVNGTVIVPTYRTEFDTIALRVLHENLPGYRIVTIDCDDPSTNIISASGAVHCITKGIGVADPLLIRHQRLTDTYNTVDPYPAVAYIRHKSGIANATLYWTTDTLMGFAPLPMSDQGGNTWGAAIPAQPANTTVYYYIQATAVSGKTQVRPIVAPAGWWHFRVLDSQTAIADPDGPRLTEVFPNPCHSTALLTLQGVRDENVRIVALDMTGREVQVLRNGPVPSDGRLYLDVSALPTGTYALTATTSLGRSSRLLIKE